MKVSQADKALILDNLDAGVDSDVIATRFRIPFPVVRYMAIGERQRWVQSLDGRGPAHLRKYIVAIRHVDGDWPTESISKIDEHRSKYDQGRVELCSGRDGYNIILYSIPRKTVAKGRSLYFGWRFDT